MPRNVVVFLLLRELRPFSKRRLRLLIRFQAPSSRLSIRMRTARAIVKTTAGKASLKLNPVFGWSSILSSQHFGFANQRTVYIHEVKGKPHNLEAFVWIIILLKHSSNKRTLSNAFCIAQRAQSNATCQTIRTSQPLSN